jgi:hypothetical protein
VTAQELIEVVDQRMTDPTVLGRLACNLHRNDLVEQRHHDGRRFSVSWHDSGDFWRCVISSEDSGTHRLAQVDIHENATVRVDAFEPCRVTVSTEDGVLCVTRYKQAA